MAIDMNTDYAQKYLDQKASGAPGWMLVQTLEKRAEKQEQLAAQGKETHMSNDRFLGLLGTAANTVSSMSPVQTREQPKVTDTGQGTVYLEPDPLFDPNEYTTGGNAVYGVPSYSSGSSGTTSWTGSSGIVGLVVAGIVAIAVLDRFIG